MKKKDLPFEFKEPFMWTDILLGILFFLALVGLGLTIALNFRPLYYWNIEWLELEKTSGLTAEVIKTNYNALIDYCSPFCFKELCFPSLPASVSGLSHFAEVKVLFNIVYVTGFLSLIGTIVWFRRKHINRERKYLKVCGIVTLIIPTIVLLFCLIDFDSFFVLFHKIAFSNDDWLFDPVTDPVINILPETYFMECAIVIAGTVLIGAVVILLVYLSKHDRRRDDSLIPGKKNYVFK